LKYCRSLKFEEKPDYVWIRRLFKDLFYRFEYVWNTVFEWAEKAVVTNFNYKILNLI